MDTINNSNQTGLIIKRQVQLESISKAIYLVTDVFDDSEPLKLSLRRVAVSVLENSDNKYIKEGLLKLISLIDISKSSGLISENNSNIMIKVVNDYIEKVNTDIIKENETINRDLDVNDILSREGDRYIDSNEVNNIDKADDNTNNTVSEYIPKLIKADTNIVKDSSKSQGITGNTSNTSSITIHNNTQNIKTINNISMDIGTRRRRILEIVKSRGSATINEFTDSIKGCSSKTIQRELTSLVLSGTLKKTGERRWSKYSMK